MSWYTGDDGTTENKGASRTIGFDFMAEHNQYHGYIF